MAKNKVEFSFGGDRELVKALNSLPASIRKKVARAALRPATKVIQRHVQANIRATLGKETGRLHKAAAVKVRAEKSKRKSMTIGFRVLVEPKLVDGEFYYPAPVQYGHRGVEPRPFVSDAFEAGGDEATQLAMDGLRDLTFRAVRALRVNPKARSIKQLFG